MPDYKTMYFQLAAKVADATESLIKAQQQGEESYISSDDSPKLKIVDLRNKYNGDAPPDGFLGGACASKHKAVQWE